jgi:hypothetical protein
MFDSESLSHVDIDDMEPPYADLKARTLPHVFRKRLLKENEVIPATVFTPSIMRGHDQSHTCDPSECVRLHDHSKPCVTPTHTCPHYEDRGKPDVVSIDFMLLFAIRLSLSIK